MGIQMEPLLVKTNVLNYTLKTQGYQGIFCSS